MKTLFAKILIGLVAAIATTILGFMLIENFIDPPSGPRRNPQFFLEEARQTYAAEGRQGLMNYLEEIRKSEVQRAFLLDSSGHDLVSGADHSELIRQAKEARTPFVRDKSSILFYNSSDGYWFFFEPPPRSGAWIQRLWPLAPVLVLCYILARHLTAPLRGLRQAVERFGNGDFTARSNSNRRDELGKLSQTFDEMAERIQTLVQNQRDLLGDISHELRSPLTRLGLAVELARSRPDKTEALNTIEKEADRLNTLVGELLSLARIENRELKTEGPPVRLDEMLEDLVEVCSVEAARHNCRLRMTTETPVTVEADEELVRRAVENVIRNAVRYAPENSDVTLAVEQSPQTATIRIRDEGPGVPQESLSRIFEPFYRVDHDRNRETGGAGLGLAIAHRATKMHGGRIFARNANPGLEVQIQLPRFRATPAG